MCQAPPPAEKERTMGTTDVARQLRGWAVRAAAIVLFGSAVAFASIESADANITPAGGNSASETRTVTFWQPNQWPVPVVFAAVKYEAKLANTNAWWSPPPYLPTPMLAVVTFGAIEQINAAGVSWGVTRNLQIVGTGSLNGYLTYFGMPPLGTPAPYHLTCAWIPAAHQCWRGVPHSLIPTSSTIRVDYTTVSGLPWAYFSGGNGTIQYVWW
jgi:hypothetical protein